MALATASLLGHASAEPTPRDDTASLIQAAEAAPPLPKPRPANGDVEAADDEAIVDGAPLPRPRPDGISRATPSEEAELPRLAPGEHAACMSELEEIGITAEVLPELRDQRCGMRWPLRLAQIGDGERAIDLMPPAKIRCPIAEALAAWMESAVQPAAEEHLGARVTGLRIASSYVCRTRNHATGARLSEHALGNAIDISAFEIDGEAWLAVGPREEKEKHEAQFQSEVREEACAHFHTVLGPGLDAYHTNHFHLDLARRGSTGKGRYCR